MKVISFGNEYKIKAKKALDLVYDLVGSTLGPYGTNITLDRAFSVPITTNDGVSIARDIEVEDDIERQAVEMIKEVALRTNEEAGDGTTTSVVLAHALVEEGLKYNDNPTEIRRSLEQAKIKAVAELKELSVPLKTDKQILDLAIVSTESEEMGTIIADTFKAIGRKGLVSVEESKLPDTEVKIVEGYEVEKGFASAYMQHSFAKPQVLVIGERLTNVPELLPILNKLIEGSLRDFVIFCVDIDSAVTNTLLLNRQQGIFNCLVVRAHSQKNEVLEDIALVTGATFISKEAGFKLENIQLDMLGSAEKITATKDKTIILKGIGNPENKLKELRELLPTITDDNEYDLVEKRIARLDNSIAVIGVGAKTETEMRDKYYKIEDGVNAVKSAIEEGIVEGGGLTLYKVSQTLIGETVGERILKTALQAPFKKIVENCGRDYATILMNMPAQLGYDAKEDTYVDMFKAGIIDPTKVERCCIENAVSFAGTFLTSKGAIAVRKEKPKEQ